MRKCMLSLLLVACAGNAAAEWTVFQRETDSTTYVDKSRIQRSDGTVKVWFLFDNDKPSPMTAHSSVVSLFEFDCKDGRERLLQGTAYKGQKGEGASVFTSNRADPWVYVEPNSFREPRLKLACKK